MRLGRLVAADAWAGPDAGRWGDCLARCWARVRDFRWEADHDFQLGADEVVGQSGEAVGPGGPTSRRGELPGHRERQQQDALQKVHQADLFLRDARRRARSGDSMGPAPEPSGVAAGAQWQQEHWESEASRQAVAWLAQPQERQVWPQRECVAQEPERLRELLAWERAQPPPARQAPVLLALQARRASLPEAPEQAQLRARPRDAYVLLWLPHPWLPYRPGPRVRPQPLLLPDPRAAC